ncbi:MAG: hypothetical protein QOF61_2219 [Acidobacteriota bacterium]|nr:hypothetical protein [Acidobacteriota bacterium]
MISILNKFLVELYFYFSRISLSTITKALP